MIFNKLFTQYLINKSVISDDVANNCCKRANEKRVPVYAQLIDDKIFDEEKIYQILADYLEFKYRFYQLSEIDLELVEKYPRDILIQYQCVPFALNDNTLTVLGSNPFKIEEIKELLLFGGKKINFILCPPTQTKRILDYSRSITYSYGISIFY